jgi:predicted amidophosphoribosyltransferase
VARATTVPSSYHARLNGTHSPTFEEHVASMRLPGPVPRGRTVWIVDNVITTGATIAAVAQVLGVRVAGAIVFADATEYVSPFNPPRPA